MKKQEMTMPQSRVSKLDADNAPRWAIVAGMSACMLLLALVMLAVIALMGEPYGPPDQRAIDPTNPSPSAPSNSPLATTSSGYPNRLATVAHAETMARV